MRRVARNKNPAGAGFHGVDNAARTRDLLNHNQLLYQLSYIHHVWHPKNGFAQQMNTIHEISDNANSASRVEFPSPINITHCRHINDLENAAA